MVGVAVQAASSASAADRPAREASRAYCAGMNGIGVKRMGALRSMVKKPLFPIIPPGPDAKRIQVAMFVTGRIRPNGGPMPPTAQRGLSALQGLPIGVRHPQGA